MGSRSRYSELWKRVSGGIAYNRDAVTIGNAFNYAVDTASNDTYLASVPGIEAYTAGLIILLNPVTDNTGACSLNINSIGAKNVKIPDGNDPGDAWIDASQIVLLCYDGTNFILMTYDANP